MIDISIIIVNYKVKEFIIPCIDSIYKNKPNKFLIELIVIDNNSNDNSVELIKKKFHNLILIENNKNVGFSVAVNQGVKKAKGKYLFILNPDTLIIEDSLSKLILFARKQKNVGIIGPCIISNLNKIQQSFWRKTTLINTIISIYHLDFLNFKKNYSNISKKIMEVDSISGCAFFISKKIFNSLNGFNIDLFWMEDIDFCLRAQKAGYENYYFPKTKIIHFEGKSSEKNWFITISNQLISKIKYFKIHHTNIEVYILRIAILLISFLKFLFFKFLSIFSSKYKTKVSAYINTLHKVLINNF